jgi:hypothetical protein
MSRLAVFLTVGLMLLGFASGVAIARSITCTGGICEGTNQEDTMRGSITVPDTIIAKAGNDKVNSTQGGEDTVKGGRGSDRIDVQEVTVPNSSDFVDCGRGIHDRAFVDWDDTALNCEIVNP